MRTAVLKKSIRGHQVSQSYSMPAPVGGWNAVDSIASMPESDANILDNFFPEPEDVRVRKGQFNHVTGIGSQVESLMPYNEPDGTMTLFCAAGTAFYDVTSSGAVGAAVQSSLTNARWQSLNFTNSSGTTYLCCFNGVDGPRYWDSSAWTTITAASSPAITGITPTQIINAISFKRRMYLVQKDSLKFWYLPVDSVGGLAKSFDLAGIADKGGYIMSIATWTLDSGEGMDDYFVIVTSEGQALVYKGTDPSSSTTWSLAGVWNLGEPIGRRCLMKFQGEILFISVDGVFPLSQELIASRADPTAALTYKIRSAMSSATALYKTNYGWQLLHYPQANMLLLNVPIAEGSTQEQYAMNTITKAWGRFQAVDANCWCIFNEKPYFGGNGIVGEFWQVLDDNGSDIAFDVQQAFSYFGTKRLKQFKSMRPNLLSNGSPEILMGVNVDFDTTPITGTASFTPTTSPLWDTAVWDSSVWGSDNLLAYLDWQTVHGVGTTAAPRMKGQVQGIELRFAASDHLYENGGVIG